MDNKFNQEFWTSKYKENETGWDIGYVSTPLKEYIDQIEDKSIKILVPGAGNAYEVEYLWKQGFENVWLLDISAEPIESFKKKVPDFPEQQLLLMDFFDLNDNYDLVVEQTFFCALDPSFRKKYAKKMSEIINPGGKIVGVLFGVEFDRDGPPFGGKREEYLEYFAPYFEIKVMEKCYNSIPPRSGNELFINLVRK